MTDAELVAQLLAASECDALTDEQSDACVLAVKKLERFATRRAKAIALEDEVARALAQLRSAVHDS